MGALALLLSGLVVASAPPAAAAEHTITEGTVTWGIKESWRNYIGVSGTTLSGGVTRNETGEFDWPVESGTFDDETNSLRLDLAGEAHFQSYCTDGAQCLLDSAFKDLHVDITATEQVIRGTYSGIAQDDPGGDRIDYPDIVLAKVDVSDAEVTTADGDTTWSPLKTYNAEAPLYPSGIAFDPVTIAYSGPGGVPDLGESFDPPGAPALTPDVTWVSDDISTTTTTRRVYGSQDHDIVHVVELIGWGTANVSYELRALDSVTMEEKGVTTVPLGTKRWFQTAFDPQTDSVFFVSGRTEDDHDVADVYRAAYDPESPSYQAEKIGEVAFPTSRTQNTVHELVWNPVRSELAVFTNKPNGGDIYAGWDITTFTPEAEGGWTKQSSDLRLPDDGLLSGSSIINVSLFGLTSSFQNSYRRAAVLRDGSYVYANQGANYQIDGVNRKVPAMWIHPSGDAGYVVDLIDDTKPPYALSTELYTYARAVTASDGTALMYSSAFAGTYQWIDIVDGEAKPVTGHVANGDDAGLNLGAAVDSVNGIEYTFNVTTMVLTAWIAKQPVATWRVDDGLRTGTAGEFPMAVTSDGSVIIQVKDSETGNAALRRYRFDGITPTIATQPESKAVSLPADVASKDVTFTSTATGGTGETTRQWQVRALGEQGFTDIAGATGETLTVEAKPGMDGTEYRAVYTNDAGKVVSEVATLSVEFAPRIVADARNLSVTEGTDAVFLTSFDAHPQPDFTWQRRVGGFWQNIADDDDNYAVASADGVSTLTVKDANVDQSDSLFRVRATNSAGSSYSRAAKLTVNPAVTIPDDGLSLDGVVLEWTGSDELQSAPPFGGSNYFSAGVSAGNEATYEVSEGEVSIVHQASDGTETTPTWATRAAQVSGDVTQLIRLDGGKAEVETDGSATVQWDGSWSVNFYGGLVPFTITDPELTVDEDGAGTLTADLSGYASTMENPEVRTPIDTVQDVTIAAFEGVEIDPAGKVTIDPDYAGVELDVPEGQNAQNRSVDGWGSWPQAFVDFHFETGLSSYWYSSGGTADPKKPPAPFAVDFTDAEPSEGEPEPTVPVITAQPVSQSVAVGADVTLSATATGEELAYRWQKRIGSLWIDVPDESGASLALSGVVAEDAGHYRARVSNSAGSVTSATATLTVSKNGSKLSLSAPGTIRYGKAATVVVSVPGRTGEVTLTGAGSVRTATLRDGKATFALPKTLSAKRYALRASYAGDTTNGAASATKTLTVKRASVSFRSLKVTKKPTSKRSGRATVVLRSATGAAVSGRVTVTLKKGKSTKKVTVTVRGGKATVRLPKLAKGTWRLTAAYKKSTNFNARAKTVRVKVVR